MSSDLSGSIGLLLLFLLMSFYFSATETAITAAGRLRLKALENSSPGRKKGFMWLSGNTHLALTVTLIGNNIVNIAASAVATSVATNMWSVYGAFIAVAVMTALIVIFCEILPKNISVGYSDKVLILSLPILRFCYFLFRPLIYVVQGIVWFIGRMLGLRLDAAKSFITREDLDMMLNESAEDGGPWEEDERKMIHGVISFEETRVSEIMIPRTDMKTVPCDMTVAEASAFFISTGLSRVPAFETDLDKITGMLYAKDLLAPMSNGLLDDKVTRLLRKPLFIPETVKTDETFDLMKRSQIHIAIVVDEYGGTAGLVTLEDLIEEIVGDIQDEYDDESPDILDEGNGSYLVQGYVNLEDLSDVLGYDFGFDNVDTAAGMLLSIVGNFPKAGECVTFGPWKISAVEVVDHRILQIRLEHIEEEESENAG
ncbi:hypothetical protein FACS1894167_13110 [Synergistales bacterium]|nr:hypothetical protein FACS1894167_13110 [Synergistales bacterium]